jgi:hypothetical protein
MMTSEISKLGNRRGMGYGETNRTYLGLNLHLLLGLESALLGGLGGRRFGRLITLLFLSSRLLRGGLALGGGLLGGGRRLNSSFAIVLNVN